MSFGVANGVLSRHFIWSVFITVPAGGRKKRTTGQDSNSIFNFC